jgi:hypothetical protein
MGPVLLLTVLLGQSGGLDARARQQFQEAEARFEQGDLRGAERLFLESYAAVRLAPTAWNIARCAQAQGAVATAIGWYRRYLQLRPTASDRVEVEKTIAGLEKRLTERKRQALTLFLTPSSAAATIDGQAGTMRDGESVELEPGPHRVVVTAEGFVSTQLEFRLSPSVSQELSFTLAPRELGAPLVVSMVPEPSVAPEPLPPPVVPAPVSFPPPVPPTKVVAPSRPFRVGLWGRIGLGVTGGALVVAGASALVADMTSMTLRDGMQRPQREGDQLVGTIRTTALVANIGWISAGVSALFSILALGFGW